MKKTQFSLIYILSVFMAFAMFSCKNNEPKPYLTVAKFFEDFEKDTTVPYLTKGTAYSGKSFIHADSTNQYPYGHTFELPDSLKNTNLKVYVNALVRTGIKNPRASFAVTINGKDSSFIWKEMFMTPQLYNVNQWNIFSDSISIPKEEASYLPLKLNVFSFFTDGKTFLDIDDVSIEIKSQSEEK